MSEYNFDHHPHPAGPGLPPREAVGNESLKQMSTSTQNEQVYNSDFSHLFNWEENPIFLTQETKRMGLHIKILVFCIFKKHTHPVDLENIDIRGFFYVYSVLAVLDTKG